LSEIEKDFQALPGLLSNLEGKKYFLFCLSFFIDALHLVHSMLDLKTVTTRHSQLATAQENLKHLILVPKTVKEMEHFISEGRLLEAHKVNIFFVSVELTMLLAP